MITHERDTTSPISVSVSLRIGFKAPLPSSRTIKESGLATGVVGTRVNHATRLAPVPL